MTMVDRISSGQTTRTTALPGRDAGRDGGKATKTDALKQRQATSGAGAQLRTHKQGASVKTQGGQKAGQSFFQRYFSKTPPTPQQVRQQERAERRQRLRQQGPTLAQHKKEYAQARSEHTRDIQKNKETQAGGKETLSGSTRGARDEGAGKQEVQKVDVPAFKHDEHRMRDKLGALDEFTKLRAEGKSVRFVEPKSTLPQRSAILHEGRRSFFGQAGAKFKDVMLRIFRPQKWQQRQVALGEARKAEFAYIKRNHEKQLAVEREQNKQSLALAKDMDAIHKRSLEESVEKPSSVPRHLGEKLTYKSDPELLKNPDYVRERVEVLEQIAQKRVETESAALAKTRAKLDAQLRAAPSPSQSSAQAPADPRSQAQPTAAPRAAPRTSAQTDL